MLHGFLLVHSVVSFVELHDLVVFTLGLALFRASFGERTSNNTLEFFAGSEVVCFA